MERGLFWLPLLALFIGLAWAGWNEYQKLEAYRAWADQFEHAKYDVYSVLGQKGDELTWGKPTRKGPIDLQTFSLKNVTALQLLVAREPVDLSALPSKGRNICLEFQFADTTPSTFIPFTEIPLAARWFEHLQKELTRLGVTSY
jgi:hypothetical protein